MRLLAYMIVTVLGTACATFIKEDVDYSVYRLPVDDFKKLDFLGVPKIIHLQKDHNDFLIDRIKACGQFNKVSALNTTVKLATGDSELVKKELRRSLGEFQDARYVHGALVVELTKNQLQRETRPTRIVGVIEHPDYDWFDSYGAAVHPRNELFASEEIAPKQSFEVREDTAVTLKFSIGLRYALYNKETNRMVFDHTSAIEAVLVNYSKNPVFDRKDLQFYLMRQLLLRIERNACPYMGKVKRVLYASKGEKPADRLVAQGLEFAGDDKWDKAADTWKKAILSDRKNAFAHHNLGIYFERAGNIPAAIEEFQKGKLDSKDGMPRLDLYDQALSFLRPRLDPDTLEPRIFTALPTGWVSIYGGDDGTLKMERIYAVYRVKKHMSAQNAPDGLEWQEVGKVRLVKRAGQFILGRVVQYQQSTPVEMGDVLLAIPD